MSLARGLRQQLKKVINTHSEVEQIREEEFKMKTRSHIVSRPMKQIQLIKKLNEIQKSKALNGGIEGYEPRHDGKIRKYFNIGIKKSLEDNNGGVPVSLTALNHNREFMIKHLISPSQSQ